MNTSLPSDLRKLKAQFESWRRTREKKGPIPTQLRKAAVALLDEHAATTICRVCRLHPRTLQEPIATGVIEGACRYLVKDRIELTGARWRLEGAEAVLQLRSLHASGDFDEYWEFHLQQEYKRNHEARYENGQVPVLSPAPKSQTRASHLRLVQ
jgi:hypothetical protein